MEIRIGGEICDRRGKYRLVGKSVIEGGEIYIGGEDCDKKGKIYIDGEICDRRGKFRRNLRTLWT